MDLIVDDQTDDQRAVAAETGFEIRETGFSRAAKPVIQRLKRMFILLLLPESLYYRLRLSRFNRFDHRIQGSPRQQVVRTQKSLGFRYYLEVDWRNFIRFQDKGGQTMMGVVFQGVAKLKGQGSAQPPAITRFHPYLSG